MSSVKLDGTNCTTGSGLPYEYIHVYTESINESPNPTVGAAIMRLKFLVTAKIHRRDVGQMLEACRKFVGDVFKILPAVRLT